MRHWITAAVLLLSACAPSTVHSGPPEIDYGREICLQCGMIISEARYAAAYRLPDGTERTFDDLGGLLVYGHEHGELSDSEVWVHDVETEAWVRAERAWYVMTRDRHTPMGYGIVAFGDRSRAEARAAEVGTEAISWPDLLAIPLDRIQASRGGEMPSMGSTDGGMGSMPDHDGS